MANRTRSLLSVPTELLITISEALPSIRDLSALARTSSLFYSLVNPRLYTRDAAKAHIALSWAATHDIKPTAQKSISAGADVQSLTDYDPRIKGCTPLMLAAYHGSIEILKLLLTFEDVNPNSRDRKYIRPPISWAIKQNHTAIVRALLADERLDVNLEDKWGDTPLMVAVEHNPRIVSMLLQRGRADPRIANQQGVTPLSRAAMLDVEADLLLAAHVQCILDGDNTAEHCQHVFFHAAIVGQLDIVEYLVSYFGEKLDPNGERDGHGRGAFAIAAERNHVDVVRYLCQWEKTNPNLSDSWEHDTPLFRAAKHGRIGMVTALLECERVDVEQGNVRGTRPLAIAAANNHGDIVRCLLKGPRQANVNTKDDNGHTPLYQAAVFGHLQAVDALLEAEDIELTRGDGIDGTTPLDAAIQYGHHEIAGRLRQYLTKS
jgi:ankyrin repeat protein